MSKPISPDEVGTLQHSLFPSELFEAVNELIAENMSEGNAQVKQSAIKTRFQSKTDKPFLPQYLNLEEAYEKFGWKVDYEKPDYNGSGSPFFTFTKKRKR